MGYHAGTGVACQGNPMFSTIVVGTDGSATAALAVAQAVQLARRSGATLHLVAAFQMPAARFGDPCPAPRLVSSRPAKSK